MSDKNGRVTLSAIDFLGLADRRRVVEVDLSEVGHNGIVYVRELSTAEKQDIMGRPKGKGRMFKDQSMEIDWSQMPDDAASKFLKACLVTDMSGAKQMYDLWLEQEKRPHQVMERLEKIPNAVTNLIVKHCRQISGLNDERNEVEEKKES